MNPPPSISFNTNMSSSAADSAGRYDVLLSFRGTDTRYGFTDYLYNDLVEAGIYTFRDSEKLQIGEEIGHDLLKAIEGSKIWIPIFSVNYAASKWCLREFAHIVKCQMANEGRKIYPIFYYVDVYDVKNQQGSYEKAFREHEKNFDEKTVQEWREALKTVGKFKGYELKTETNRHEGSLVKKLVKDVLIELKKNYADVRDDLVGMDHHVQEMTRLIEVESDGVRIVGVHGMGGIGKTTISKAIYNQLCDSFDGCCFLEDVREKAKQHPYGLVDLQKQIVFQISKKDFPDIVNVNEGIKKIKEIVHVKKVLVVLDDLDEKSQFDKLAGECDWFNKASRIIVTTRNKEVLDAIEATCSGKGLHEAYRSYEPDLMTDSDSLKLFSKYAFMRDSPPEDYLSLSQRVTFIAARLPLVLVTLGSLFLGIRNKDRWVGKLKKLEKVPNKDVTGKLKISFDALDDDEKKIFLDIACFFIGKDKTKPYYMWEDCEFVPEDGINTLVLRSLVKIGDDNKLRMHDHIRDLGRQIVREEKLYKLSRMWRPEEALNVLEGGLGVESVEALNLNLSELQYEEVRIEGNVEGWEYYSLHHLKGQSLRGLQNLRFLRLRGVILDTDFRNLFSNLRWLKWRCYNSFVPVNLNMKNLVILNLSYSEITDEWEGWNQLKASKKLKALNLSGCSGLIRGPNLSNFNDLESLNMKRCESIIRLPDMSNLRRLKKLVLEGCIDLLDIEGLGGLVSLEHLNINYCKSIVRLPDVSNLRRLKRLLLAGCYKLHDIEGLRGLVSLEHLDMKSCIPIERLPRVLNMMMLRKLYIKHCENLHDIESLGSLVSLEYLNLSECKSIVRLPDLSNLRMLKILEITICDKLTEIRGLGGLIFLEDFVIGSCDNMERLPDLSNLGKLKRLVIAFLPQLHEIEGLSGLVSLEILYLRNCSSLENSLDFSVLKNLKKLHLTGLKHWTGVRGIEELKSLQELYVSNCSSLEKLPDVSNLSRLKEIDAEGCKKLREIEGFGGLLSLETLCLRNCISLENSLDFSVLKNLKKLHLKGLEHWTVVRGIEELKSLQELDVSKCWSLEKLPDFSNLTSLKELDAQDCTKLREIEGLSGLVSLETLSLRYCSSLENSLDFSCLKNLKKLELSDLEHWTEVKGIEELNSLQVLDVSYCRSLEKLPDLSNLTSLERVLTNGCTKLQDWEEV